MRRIYPVPVKPASHIDRWSAWPVDVQETLRAWNRGCAVRRGAGVHFLSFRRDIWLEGMRRDYVPFARAVSVFKCCDCSVFCKSHPYGAAVLDGDWLCDDCLIDRARKAVA